MKPTSPDSDKQVGRSDLPPQIQQLKQLIERTLSDPSSLPPSYSITAEHDLSTPFHLKFPALATIPKNEFLAADDHLKQDIYTLLFESLSHHTANPSYSKNREKWELIYTYGTKRDTKLESLVPINSSTDSVAAFLDEIITAAKEVRQYKYYKHYHSDATDFSKLSTSIANKSRYILVGAKGCGKTTFLNYILSAHNDRFDSEYIIVIRHDIKEHSDALKLYDHLRWKICKVLYTYYDKTQHNIDPKKLAKHLLVDLSLSNRRLTERLSANLGFNISQKADAYEAFRLGFADAEDPKPVDEAFFRSVYEYLTLDGIEIPDKDAYTSHKIGFVIIIDNLDKLGLTSDDRQEYERRKGELEEILANDDMLYGSFLISVRHETYLSMHSRTLYHPYPVRTLALAEPFAILKKRLDLMKKPDLLAHSGFHRLYQMRKKDFEADIEALLYEYLSFIAYSLSFSTEDKPEDDPAKAFEYLERLFGNNRRMLIEALRDCISYYLNACQFREIEDLVSQSISLGALKSDADRSGWDTTTIYSLEQRRKKLFSKYYLITEALLVGEFQYRPSQYLYKFPELCDSQVTPPNHKSNYFKIQHIPDYIYNIYGGPSPSGRKCRSSPFVCIRIIQYLLACPEWRADRQAIVLFLLDFDYSESLINIMIDEMTENGLLSIACEGLDEIVGMTELTERGEHIYYRYAGSLEYLALVLESTPLAWELLHDSKGRPWLPIGPHPSEEYVAKNKVVAASRFVAILSGIEKLEEDHFNQKCKARKETKSFRDYDMAIMDEIKDLVRPAIAKIIDSAYMQRHETLQKLLEEGILGDANH